VLARSRAHETRAFTTPDVPEALVNPPNLTAEVETLNATGERASKQRKTITRTATRVHVSLGDDAIEWLFIRNPIDGH
jgi:hypothetical protein